MTHTTTEECVYLIGRPPISEFIGFIQTQTVDSHLMDSTKLTEEWRLANERVKEIEKVEEGFGDDHILQAIPQKLNYLLEELNKDEIFKKAYGFMPYEFGMVELDRLIVYQKFINLKHVDRIKRQIEKDLSDEAIFKLCFPYNLQESETAGINHQQVSSNAYHFVSASNDLRYLDTILLKKEQIQGYIPNGLVAGIVAIVVGFGTNYLSAVSVDNRLILNNGSHRAYALRDLGITHIPCVVQKVHNVDELELFGSNIISIVQRYHDNGRPPLLKDYFDSRLRKIVSLSSKKRHLQVNFNIDTSYLPV
jgi:hypothetical protein